MKTLFFFLLLASSPVLAQQDTTDFTSCQCCNNEAKQAEKNRMNAANWKNEQEAPSTFMDDVGESGETIAKGLYQGEVKPLLLGRIIGEIESWFGSSPIGTAAALTTVAGASRAVQKSRNQVCHHTCKKNSPQTLSLQNKTDSSMKTQTFYECAKANGLRTLTPKEKNDVLQLVQSYGYAQAINIAFNDEMVLVEGGNLKYYAGLEYVSPVQTTKAWELYEAEAQGLTLINRCKKIVGEPEIEEYEH